MESEKWPYPGKPHGGSTSGQGDAQSRAGGASQHTHESKSTFPFHFDPFPVFSMLTEGLQHQGLCWSRQRNCLNTPGFDLFCFHLFFSELAGQTLIPVRHKSSACQGVGEAGRPGLYRHGWHPTLPTPASHTAHSSIPGTNKRVHSSPGIILPSINYNQQQLHVALLSVM